MNRGAYIIKRLGLAVPVMMFGITMSFLILYLGPIDPVGSILGQQATPEDIRQLRMELNYIDAARKPRSPVGAVFRSRQRPVHARFRRIVDDSA